MKRFNFLLEKNDKINLFILLILLFVTTFLELIGIGSIPIFVSAIFNPEYLSENLPYLNNFNLFDNCNNYRYNSCN